MMISPSTLRKTIVAASGQHVVEDHDVTGPEVVGIAALGHVEVGQLGQQRPHLGRIGFGDGTNFW